MVNAALHLSCMTHTHKCTAPNPHAQDSLCVACACMPCAFELRCVTWHSCHMHECNAIQGARHMPAHTRTHTRIHTYTRTHTHSYTHTRTRHMHACPGAMSRSRSTSTRKWRQVTAAVLHPLRLLLRPSPTIPTHHASMLPSRVTASSRH